MQEGVEGPEVDWSGVLDGRQATTRRRCVGAERQSPLDLLARSRAIKPVAAAIVDDVVVTGGGVSLAIDATLYLIGKLYGVAVRDEIARAIEYDRAFNANATAFGMIASG